MSMQPDQLPPLDTTNDLLGPTGIRVRWGPIRVNLPEGGKDMFVISFYGPHGCFTAMFEFDQAENLAAQLADAVRLAKTGIVVAPKNIDLSAFLQNGKR